MKHFGIQTRTQLNALFVPAFLTVAERHKLARPINLGRAFFVNPPTVASNQAVYVPVQI